MATKTVKYDIGQRVHYDGVIPGQVTAIYIRGKGTAYEFSYIDRNGCPVSTNCEEVELTKDSTEPQVGFKKADRE